MAPLRTYKGRKQSIHVNQLFTCKESSFDRLIGINRYDKDKIFETSSDKDNASSNSKNEGTPAREKSFEEYGCRKLMSPVFFHYKPKNYDFDKCVSSDDSPFSKDEIRRSRRKKPNNTEKSYNKRRAKKVTKAVKNSTFLASTPKLDASQKLSTNCLHESPVLIQNETRLPLSVSNQICSRNHLSETFQATSKEHSATNNNDITSNKIIQLSSCNDSDNQLASVKSNSEKFRKHKNDHPLLHSSGCSKYERNCGYKSDSELECSRVVDREYSCSSFSTSLENNSRPLKCVSQCKSPCKHMFRNITTSCDSLESSYKGTDLAKIKSTVKISEISKDPCHIRRGYDHCRKKKPLVNFSSDNLTLDHENLVKSDLLEYGCDNVKEKPSAKPPMQLCKSVNSFMTRTGSFDSIKNHDVSNEPNSVIRSNVMIEVTDTNKLVSPSNFKGFDSDYYKGTTSSAILKMMVQQLSLSFKSEKKSNNQENVCVLNKNLKLAQNVKSTMSKISDSESILSMTQNRHESSREDAETGCDVSVNNSDKMMKSEDEFNPTEQSENECPYSLLPANDIPSSPGSFKTTSAPLGNKWEEVISRCAFVSTRKPNRKIGFFERNMDFLNSFTNSFSNGTPGNKSHVENNGSFIENKSSLTEMSLQRLRAANSESACSSECLLDNNLKLSETSRDDIKLINHINKICSYDKNICLDANSLKENKENLNVSRSNLKSSFEMAHSVPQGCEALNSNNLSKSSALNCAATVDLIKLDKHNERALQEGQTSEYKTDIDEDSKNAFCDMGENLVLPSGKKYRRSMMIIRHLLNYDSDAQVGIKGRNYESSVAGIINLQSPGKFSPHKKKNNSLQSVTERASTVHYGKLSPYKKITNSLQPITERLSVLHLSTIADESLNCQVKVPKSVKRPQFSMCIKSNLQEEYFGENCYEDAVLRLCKQKEICNFEHISGPDCFESCKKIGEGLFGEVFSLDREGGFKVVLKVIPIEGDICVNGECQKSFEEIYSELMVSYVLDSLKHENKDYMTEGFAELVKAWLVRGRYPDRLLELWHEFDECKGSENDSPEMFQDDQLYLVLEVGNAGSDLECYSFTNACQTVSVFKQVACSLAVAEAKHEFEHRDLHWGNVLVAKTFKKSIRFTLNAQTHCVKTAGVKATIIDYTLSSLTTCGGNRVYNDIGKDPDMFTATGDYQFDIYRHMREDLGNDWKLFVPKTNVRWLHYLLSKMIKGVIYERKTSKLHKYSMQLLKDIESWILDCNSSVEIVLRIMDDKDIKH